MRSNFPDAVGLERHRVEDERLWKGGPDGPQPRAEVVQVEEVHGRLGVGHLCRLFQRLIECMWSTRI